MLILQLVIYYFQLGVRMVVHPATFFAVIWLFSVLSQSVLMKFGLAFIRDYDSIDELNVYVIFTSLFFIIWIVFLNKTSTRNAGNIEFSMRLNVFGRYLQILIIGALLQMFYTWILLGVNSFNLAHIRDLNTSDKTNYLGTESDLFLSLIKYTQFFYPIASIMCGYLIGRKYLLGQMPKLKMVYLYIPLIVSFIYVVTNGGRNPLFVGVKLYFVGLCFALPGYINSPLTKWILRRVVVLIFSLVLFSTIVADSRSEYNKQDAFSDNFDSPILSSVSGFIEYLGAHYYGFQLRNIDTFDESDLGLGYYTFFSFFDVKLPLSNYIGIKSSIGESLGFKENKIDYFYLWKNEMEGYYTTNSIYLDLKLDFGFIGTLLFLFVYTFYTCWLFLKIQDSRNVTLYTIFWFYLCFNFWASSNFKSSYSSGVVAGFIMTWLFIRFFGQKNLSRK